MIDLATREGRHMVIEVQVPPSHQPRILIGTTTPTASPYLLARTEPQPRKLRRIQLPHQPRRLPLSSLQQLLQKILPRSSQVKHHLVARRISTLSRIVTPAMTLLVERQAEPQEVRRPRRKRATAKQAMKSLTGSSLKLYRRSVCKQTVVSFTVQPVYEQCHD